MGMEIIGVAGAGDGSCCVKWLELTRIMRWILCANADYFLALCILHGSFALVHRQVKAAFLLQCVIVFIDIAEYGGDNYVADGFAVA